MGVQNELAAANEHPTAIVCHPGRVVLRYRINHSRAIQSGLGESRSYACHRHEHPFAARPMPLKDTFQAPEESRPP